MATEIQVQPLPRVAAGISWRQLATGGTVVVFGSAAANALSFLFSFATAHLLAPEEYATVTAALSLLVIVTVPAATLQLIAARYSAIWGQVQPALGEALGRWLGRIAMVLGLALAAAVAALATPLAQYLRIPSRLPVFVVAGVLACSFVGPVYRGLLQGHHRFGLFAVASTSEFAIRVLAAAVLVLLGLHEAGALLGVFIGAGCAAWLAWWFARVKSPAVGRVSIPWKRVIRWSVPTLLVQGALTALLFQDTLFAKHFFTPQDAGIYAGLATTARVLVYASGPLTAVLFPVVARIHGNDGDGRFIASVTLAVLTVGELLLLAAFALKPALILRVVVGSQYDAAQGYLPQIALALAAYSIVSTLASYFLATGGRAFWLPLMAAPVAEGALMTVFHQNVEQFVHTIDAVMLSALVVLVVVYFKPRSWVLFPRREAEWQ